MYLFSEKTIHRLTKSQKEIVEQYTDDAKRFIRTIGLLNSWTQSEIDAVAEDALLRAARTYDPDKGNKFTTYLWWAIKNESLNALKRKKEGDKPQQTVSIDAPAQGLEGDDIALVDTLKDINALDPYEYIDYITIKQELEDKLNDREKEVLKNFLEGYTFAEIGKKLQITTGRISQIMDGIGLKLKEIQFAG